MSSCSDVPLTTTHLIRDTCLCLHTQRAARRLARRFDEAFRPLGITSGQFSLLAAVNRPEAPPLGAVAMVLAMDRTTLTAALKPLERQGLVAIARDAADKRKRRIALTAEGSARLAAAVPVWQAAHDAIEAEIGRSEAADLRRSLGTIG